MKYLQTVLLSSLVALLFSCGSQSGQEQSQTPHGSSSLAEITQTSPKNEPAIMAIPEADTTTLRSHPKLLFYGKAGAKLFYMVSDKPLAYDESFNGQQKYGLVDDSLKIWLPQEYDKISNPDLSIRNCFEISQGKKVGLYNYQSQQILPPKFDFILPSGSSSSDIAYGYIQGQWHKIDSKDLSESPKADFDPSPVLKKLSFDIARLGNSLMYNRRNIEEGYEENNDYAKQGSGVLIYPSYISYFKLNLNPYIDDIELPQQGEYADFGVSDLHLHTTKTQTLSEKLISFFVSVYEEGVDGREYYYDKQDLVVYNKENQQWQAIHLGQLEAYDSFCKEADYRFANDSIIEVKSNKHGGDDKLYDFETRYQYYSVAEDGTINTLKSNRHFSYTEWIVIDSSYFTGCFANYRKAAGNTYEDNMWVYNHLSIEDLDLMRNEIFASYGYIFKTDKWKYYFAPKRWYKPRHENIDNQLTPIDKANIETILKMRKAMEGREDEVVNKKLGTYVAAG